MESFISKSFSKAALSKALLVLGMLVYLCGAFLGIMGMPFSAILTVAGALACLYFGFKIFEINSNTISNQKAS